MQKLINNFRKNSKQFISLLTLIVVIFGIFLLKNKGSNTDYPTTKVNKGEFSISLAVTGELEAEKSQMVLAPEELGNTRFFINEIKIQDLVPEGTIVKKGDYVAQLDPSALHSKLAEELENIEKQKDELYQKQLDTALTIKEAKNKLIDLKFAIEESELKLKQSKFLPPATIREAEIAVGKAIRNYEQEIIKFDLNKRKADSEVRQKKRYLAEIIRGKEEIEDLIEKFTIYAPNDGMVIYYKDRMGERRTIGSKISPWDKVVATLPDLTRLISKTYVNELDIGKVKMNQNVIVEVDAVPGQKIQGVVKNISNIGEQLANSDAKSFEVKISILGINSALRPSMTTKNSIVLDKYTNATFVPILSIFNDDTSQFVYTVEKEKRFVDLGMDDDVFVVVNEGLSEGDILYLTEPKNKDKFKLVPINKKNNQTTSIIK